MALLILCRGVAGDYGLLNDRSHDRLQAESLAGNLDLIVHAGDFAYDLHDEDGDRGDKFMNAQQTFLAHTPMQGTRQDQPTTLLWPHHLLSVSVTYTTPPLLDALYHV